MHKPIPTAKLAGLVFIAVFLVRLAQAADLPPPYTPVSSLSGTVVSVGSDTMVYLVSFWAVDFKKRYPQVQVRISQAGSSTAPPALIGGESTIGPMSRRMKDKEIAEFEARHGYKPTEIRVALDTLAVYVNQKNPLPGLSLPQVDAVFSSARRCGEQANIATWGQAGLNGEWSNRTITLYGRNLLSGTRAFFAEHALCKGEYKPGLQMKPTSVEVVSAVIAQPGAIGYSGSGYLRNGARFLALSAKPGQPFVEATLENARNGSYPLTRSLYVYVNKAPGKPIPPLEREFLRFMLSDEGQAIVAMDGFVPLTGEQVRTELAKLD